MPHDAEDAARQRHVQHLSNEVVHEQRRNAVAYPCTRAASARALTHNQFHRARGQPAAVLCDLVPPGVSRWSIAVSSLSRKGRVG